MNFVGLPNISRVLSRLSSYRANGKTVRKKKEKKAKEVSEVDKNNSEIKCICGLCCEVEKDKEDEGIYCKGTYAQWFHCYCAGVTVPQTEFEWLLNSSSPFLCYACFQEEHRLKSCL